MRITYWQANEDSEAEVTTVKEAKRLLKEKGGFAWTSHYDRDGGLFETSKITLKGNNSKFKYNNHL